MHLLEFLIILLLSEQNMIHLNHPGETLKIWEEESAEYKKEQRIHFEIYETKLKAFLFPFINKRFNHCNYSINCFSDECF